MFEDDAESLGTPIEVAGFLSHIEGRAGSLDGISALIECRVQRLYEDGNLALVIEVGELLHTDGILVLDPRFDGSATVVVPGVGRIHIAVLERQYNPRNGAAVDAEVGNVNLQNIHALIGSVGGVVGELGVENHVILRLVVLKLDGACSEVIAG